MLTLDKDIQEKIDEISFILTLVIYGISFIIVLIMYIQ